MPTVKEILEETTRFIQAKEASFKGKKQALAGEDPSSMPGAENDKPVPAENLAADKEVDDGTQGPKGSHNSTDGAGDDSPVTRGHAVDATTASDTPATKPLLSADANAKTAEMCNDLLADIQRYRSDVAAQKQAAAPAAKPAEATKQAAAPAAKPAEAAPAAKPAEAPKSAEAPAGLNLELTAEFLQKIGAILLSTEEGTEFVDAQLRKHAGAEKAQELMAFIVEQNAEAEKIAAMQQGVADAHAAINAAIHRAGYEAGLKAAGTKKAPESLMGKLGQEVADASIADLMGGGAGAPPMDVPPEAMGAGPEVGAAVPGGDMAAGDQEISEEDVVAALEMLVQEGQLDPQDAQAILAELGAAGAPAAEAAPAEAAPAEAAPAEESEEESEPAEESEEKSDDKAAE